MNLFEAIFSQDLFGRTAVLYEQRQISYARLRDETLAAARVLRALGVDCGDRVALLLHDSPEFFSMFIAICSAGAIAVPVNMSLRTDEQRAILNDCSARFAVVETDLCDALLAGAAEMLPHLEQMLVIGRSGEKEFTAEAQSTQRKRREEGGQENEALKVWSLKELISKPKSNSMFTHPAIAESIFPQPGENQPSFIFYTSGSTGEPKGAVHRQADIFYTNETYCREVLKLRDDDRVFSSSRLPFSYGFGNSFTFPLLNGCTTILCREKPSPEVVSRIFNEYKPTIFFSVPVIYRLLLDYHKNVSPLDFSSLRLCVSAGEALPAQLSEEWERISGVEVLDGIGSTEMLHMWMSNHEGEARYGSSGKLLQGYEARLLDQEGNATPDGAEGNLWVKGASAALGYWQKPDVTARTFVNGWVRTGDLYRQEPDGYWFHMGRSDDCFKSSGQWVSPVEVEGVLLRHQGVSRAAVVEDFDANRLPCACAFVVRAKASVNNDALEQGLRELARESLPRFKQPRRYVFIDELPYTATGKIQRFKLRELLRSSEFNL